jgi:Phytanoyl-CoA dioxygenase (PhyH)
MNFTQSIPNLNLPWVDSPFFEQLLKSSSLDESTKKLVKSFAKDGYLVIDIDIDEFDVICEKIIQDLSSQYKSSVRIQDAWCSNMYVKQIATHSKVLDILKVIYQREPIPFQTLNFCKGTQQATHSDTIHFHTFPNRFMCGVWVALEDIDANNGPLHYYPGSHKLPIFDLHDIGLSGSSQTNYEYYPIYEKFIQSTIDTLKLEKVDVKLHKGQAVIWSANLLHGGSPILDANRSRHSQVTHYFFSDCAYYTPMMSDVFINKIAFREIMNISTGEIVPHTYNGQNINNFKKSVEDIQNIVQETKTPVEEESKSNQNDIALPNKGFHFGNLAKKMLSYFHT